MMGLMRKLINNNAYRVILWIFLFMMALGSGLLMNIKHEKNWVIKIYDETLSPSRFDALLKTAKYQQEEYRRRNIFIDGKNTQKEVIHSAVSDLLLEHEMSKLYLMMPSYLVEQNLVKILQQLPKSFFLANGDLNEELFSRLIAPQSIEDFLKNLQLEEKKTLLFSIIDQSAYIPSFELNFAYGSEFSKKEFEILRFSLQHYLLKAKESKPSEELLEKFYKKSKNSEEFRTEEKRAGRVWKFDEAAYNLTLSESDIKKQYEKNKSKYLVSPSQMQLRILLINNEPGQEEQTRTKVDSLHEKAKKEPELFEKLVKEFSDDKASARNGGLTPLFEKDDAKLDKLVVQTAFENLSEDGQISAPIKTSKGYEIVQRVKKVPAKYKELGIVSGEIKKELLAQKFKQRFQQDAQRVISQSKYTPDSLQHFIVRYKGNEVSLGLSSKKGGIFMQHLFKTDEGRYAVFFDGNEGCILQCTEIVKSRIPALSDVYNAVEQKYFQQEAHSALANDLAKALALLRAGNDMKFIAKEFKVNLEVAISEYKNDRVEESAILKDSAVKEKTKALHHKNGATFVITDSEGLLIRLDSIEHSKEDEGLKAKKESYAKAVLYAKKYKVKEGFIASLYRHAKIDNKIEMKPEILQLLKEA
ncbi:peptidylprolyl isomerase [Candidatus Dependentiae bacterium]|nr:peptidylprolyl isomerase [Candidatus Dependentiae bacterium]